MVKPGHYWRLIILNVACWTLFALFFSCQSYLNYAYLGRPASFWRILAPWLICSYLWALITLPVAALAQRFPIESGKLASRIGIHLLLGSFVSLLQMGIYIFLHQWLVGNSSKPFSPVQSFQNIFVAEFHFNLLLYLTIIGLRHAYDYYDRFREREQRAAQLELEAAQLETQLAQAQLDALKMQLHPHFLFNTLNSISVLIEEDPAAANKMLLRLSELLRVALKNTNRHEVTLRQELDFLRSYLEIEQTRFQNRLEVKMKVETIALEAKVPNLILQPLVENCIRHVVAARETKSLIEISAVRLNGHLELIVRDDGEGIGQPGAVSKTNGIGLSNTRARLEKLYGTRHKFELSPAAGGGLQAKILIPFSTAKNSDE